MLNRIKGCDVIYKLVKILICEIRVLNNNYKEWLIIFLPDTLPDLVLKREISQDFIIASSHYLNTTLYELKQ